jgi:hypothetical protein
MFKMIEFHEHDRPRSNQILEGFELVTHSLSHQIN